MQAVALSHYCIIANVIQEATSYKFNDPHDTRPMEKRRMRPGDVAMGGEPISYCILSHLIMSS